MDDRASLTMFAHVVGQREDEIDLLEAALLIAEPEYPGLDLASYRQQIEGFGKSLSRMLGRASGDPIVRTRRLLAHFYEDLGFHGNREDYYDPKNSFLNEVIDRRAGIPITLGIVIIEAARRAGIDARGVSFPGHFLVRFDAGDGALIADPFAGRLIDRRELRALHQRATGRATDPPASLLEPASKKQILLRVLGNLHRIYTDKHDDDRLRGVAEKMLAISPTEELREQLAKLGGVAPWRAAGNRTLN